MAATSLVTGAREAAHKVMEKIEHQKPKAEQAKSKAERHAFPIVAGLSVGSILLSLLLFRNKAADKAIFVGLWAPTFLSLGLSYMLFGPGRHGSRD
jgi:hypothetical protein